MAAVALLIVTGLSPSGATVLTTISDPVGSEVSLVPSDAAGGDYAYLDENDELVVDLSAANPNVEGVNADGVTEITSVFEIHYTGSEYAHVWLTHESDAITFAARGHPIQSESNNVTLGPNESVAVGLVVDTTGDETDGLIDEIGVHAKVADPSETTGPSGGGNGGDDGAGNGGDDDGSAVRSADTGSDAVSVRTTATDATNVDVTIENAPGGEPVEVDTNGLQLVGGNVTLDSMSVTRTDGGDVDFEATGSADPFANASESVRGVDPLGYLRVDHEVTNEELSGVTFEFSVSTAYLRNRGIDPANLTVLRRPDGSGEWTALETHVLGEQDGRVRIGVESPGFSVFAVTVNGESAGTPGVVEDTPTDEPAAADSGAAGTSNGTDGSDGQPSTDPDGDRTQSSGTATGTESPPGEPAAFGLPKALGLLGLLVIVGSTMLLVRRVPRP